MLKLQQAIRDAVDPHRRPTDIEVCDEVLVNVKAFDRPTLYLHGPLMPYFAGPYSVLRQVSPNTHELQIPQPATGNRIHPTFNVSQLRKFHSNRPLLEALDAPDEPQPDPPEGPLAPEEPNDLAHLAEPDQ